MGNPSFLQTAGEQLNVHVLLGEQATLSMGHASRLRPSPGKLLMAEYLKVRFVVRTPTHKTDVDAEFPSGIARS